MLFIQNYDTYIVGGQISSSNLFLGLKLQKWHGWGGREKNHTKFSHDSANSP